MHTHTYIRSAYIYIVYNPGIFQPFLRQPALPHSSTVRPKSMQLHVHSALHTRGRIKKKNSTPQGAKLIEILMTRKMLTLSIEQVSVRQRESERLFQAISHPQGVQIVVSPASIIYNELWWKTAEWKNFKKNAASPFPLCSYCLKWKH